MPRWLWILLALGLIGWWLAPPAARSRAPGVLAPEAPRQVDGGSEPRRIGRFTLQPLARFELSARVLGREDYALDPGAALAPTDLALGWGRMSDTAVIERLGISQQSRWYSYRWGAEGPPIPAPEIVRSSANMHMIPADAGVGAALERVREGDVVSLHGWLVEARGDDGYRWRSSLTREDSGDGACELVLVESLAIAP